MSHPIITVTCTPPRPPPLPFLELTGLLSVSDGGRSVEMSLTLMSLCSSAEEQRSASISSYRSCWLGPHRQSNALRSRAGGPGEGGGLLQSPMQFLTSFVPSHHPLGPVVLHKEQGGGRRWRWRRWVRVSEGAGQLLLIQPSAVTLIPLTLVGPGGNRRSARSRSVQIWSRKWRRRRVKTARVAPRRLPSV